MLISWAREHAGRGWVEPPNFGLNADLLEVEVEAQDRDLVALARTALLIDL